MRGGLRHQLFAEEIEFEAPLPQLLGGGKIRRPPHPRPIYFVGLLAGKIEGEGQSPLDPVQPFPDPVVKTGKNLVGGSDIPTLGQLGELGSIVVLVGFEVAFEEERVVVIQSLHIGADPFARFLLGEGLPGKMVILQEFLDEDSGGLISGVGLGNSCFGQPTGQKKDRNANGFPNWGAIHPAHSDNLYEFLIKALSRSDLEPFSGKPTKKRSQVLANQHPMFLASF